jgi:hypothetical protein
VRNGAFEVVLTEPIVEVVPQSLAYGDSSLLNDALTVGT